MKFAIASVAVMIGLAGCASNTASNGVVAAATEEQEAALLGRIKSLEGEWLGQDPQTGQMMTACVFKTSSAGSVVREVMFPGSEHEMTNMYHMDGDTLVVTHYCAVGNQPRMRATGMNGNELVFTFDSVTNRTSPKQTCMGDLTIEFIDADHIVEKWRARSGDTEHTTTFELTRKR